MKPSLRSLARTGVAVFHGQELAECGRVTTKAAYQKDRLRHSVPSHKRIDELINALSDLYARFPDAESVIEITSGKTARRLGKNVQGLATYGMAVGQVVRFAIERQGAERVHQVYENDWTRGGSKSRRQEHCRHAYPLYGQNWYERDKIKIVKGKPTGSGGDVSDAVMLGDYWIFTGRLRGIA